MTTIRQRERRPYRTLAIELVALTIAQLKQPPRYQRLEAMDWLLDAKSSAPFIEYATGVDYDVVIEGLRRRNLLPTLEQAA